MNDPLEPLRRRFRVRAAEARTELAGLAGDTGRDRFQRLVHDLAGAAGVFGFVAVSDAARTIDEQLAVGGSPGPGDLERLMAELTALEEGPPTEDA